MVIIQINSECGRGSTGKIACDISKVLTEKNVKNYIFYSGNHKSNFSNSIQINSKLAIRFHQLLSRLFGDQGFHSYFSTKRMIRRIRRIDPDVIILHNLHGYYLHVGVLFRFLSKFDKPVYWTLHDCWAFTGHCTHFQLSGCEKWKTGCNHCVSRQKYPYSWLFDRSKALYERKKMLFTSVRNLHIITPSEWLARLVRQSFLKDYPATVIHNGIDLEVFHYTENTFKKDHHIEDKKMILGVAAVWSYAKGLDVFIKIALRKPEWQVVLVGTDSDVDKHLPKGILSIHRTSNQKELAEIYSAADIFLNPTREDNYPSVNMEAIACGTPTLTFSTGGSAEMIDISCGRIAQTENIENVIETISEMLTIGKAAYQKSANKSIEFASRRCFLKYVDLIIRGG